MKKCPQCSRTYSDDTLSFCLEDGALLSASYDHDQTNSPTVAINAPDIAPTVAMPEIPPTVASNIPPTAQQEIPTVVAQEIPTVVAAKPRETQTEDKKVRWYIYLAGFFFALVYNTVLSMVIFQLGGRALFDFGNVGSASEIRILFMLIFSRTWMSIIIFGSLGAILGYRWYRAKWKWGVILALAEIPIATLYIYGYRPNYEPPIILFLLALIFLFLVTFAVGGAASYLGSMLRRKISNA